MDITLTISQNDVFAKVARITEYAGGKSEEEKQYDRVRVVDEDRAELLRYWDECRADVAQALTHVLVAEGMDGDNYNVTLRLFNTALVPMLVFSLSSFFTNAIVAKWYVYTNKQDTEGYMFGAANCLESLKSATRQRTFLRKMYP